MVLEVQVQSQAASVAGHLLREADGNSDVCSEGGSDGKQESKEMPHNLFLWEQDQGHMKLKIPHSHQAHPKISSPDVFFTPLDTINLRL